MMAVLARARGVVLFRVAALAGPSPPTVTQPAAPTTAAAARTPALHLARIFTRIVKASQRTVPEITGIPSKPAAPENWANHPAMPPPDQPALIAVTDTLSAR